MSSISPSQDQLILEDQEAEINERLTSKEFKHVNEENFQLMYQFRHLDEHQTLLQMCVNLLSQNIDKLLKSYQFHPLIQTLKTSVVSRDFYIVAKDVRIGKTTIALVYIILILDNIFDFFFKLFFLKITFGEILCKPYQL